MKYVLLWTTLVQKKTDKERKKYRFLVQSAKWWNRIIGRSIMRHIVRVDRLIWSLVDFFFSPCTVWQWLGVEKKLMNKKNEKKKWIEGDVWVTDTPLTRHLWNSRDTVGSGRGIYDTRYWPSSYLIVWGKKTLDLVVSWAGKPRSCK